MNNKQVRYTDSFIPNYQAKKANGKSTSYFSIWSYDGYMEVNYRRKNTFIYMDILHAGVLGTDVLGFGIGSISGEERSTAGATRNQTP